MVTAALSPQVPFHLMPLLLPLYRQRESLPVCQLVRWDPRWKCWLFLLPGFCWASYHSVTPVTRGSILGEGHIWQSFQVSQRKFSITIVLSKPFRFQKESSKVCCSISLLLGIVLSGTQQRAPPVRPRMIDAMTSLFSCLKIPVSTGTNNAVCRPGIP